MYSIKATLVGYPSAAFYNNATITFYDPCIRPTNVTVDSTRLQYGPYKYTGLPLEESPKEFVPYPPICEVTYSCQRKYLDQSGSDLGCNTPGLTTFDTATGVFTLVMDIDEYVIHPPGNYTYEVKG